MIREIKEVVVVVNLAKDKADDLAKEVIRYLQNQGAHVRKHAFRGQPAAFDFSGADLVVSIGGDGTVLYCAREVYTLGIPIMGVNLGNFGFITEIARDEWKSALTAYKSGELSLSERMLLQATLVRAGEDNTTFVGLNDVVINNRGLSKLIRIRTSCDGNQIGVYRSDGIIVATPTGTTAYSAAAGGPILVPEIEAVIITPICPFTLSNRPLVVPAESAIDIEIERDQKTDILLTVDGQNTMEVLPGDWIRISRAPRKALIIRSNQRNFYEVLRSKLHWTGGPDA